MLPYPSQTGEWFLVFVLLSAAFAVMCGRLLPVNNMRYLSNISIAILLLTLSFVAGRISARHGRENSSVNADTVVIRSIRVDTMRISQPVPVYEMTVDTIYVRDFATVEIHDTVYVKLPREAIVYSDSTYTAQVSGYKPALDWIEVYPRTITDTRVITQKNPGRWSLEIQAGYGVGKEGLSPYVGVGVGYTLLPLKLR